MMRRFFAVALALFTFASPAVGQIATDEGRLADQLEGAYSPYAERSFPLRPLWGDAHLHTTNSFDAGAFGNRLDLDEAYRFARGETVTTSSGQEARLSRPLDWLAITDHSDQMGMIGDLLRGDPVVLRSEQGKSYNAGLSEGGQDAVDTTLRIIQDFSQGKLDPYLVDVFAPGSVKFNSLWERMVMTAEAFNDPGNFTALIGYEWTSLVSGGNMHRNVILRDGPRRALQVVPFTMQEPYGSTDPLDLYEWLKSYQESTKGFAMAIAHNGNLSNGIMFPVDAQFSGRKIDEAYAKARAKWEPLYEVTQIKGDGEAHPPLSPDDKFADYETWDVGNLDVSVAKTDDMLQYEYAREALKNGLLLERRLGTNPYKFGLEGSTDSHTSLATAQEDNFFGKHTGYEPSPDRLSHSFMKTDQGEIFAHQMTSSGLTAVWTEENTREAIWDAMKRKEVYATTGSRMFVRFFGGWEYTEEDLVSRQPAHAGYTKGVPMGGDLLSPPEGATAPTFMVYAIKDALLANLDRIQIVKGWLDADDETHEKVYNVVWAGDRELDANGELPPVGNTVDVKTASWSNTIGDMMLKAVWTDPDFDASQPAFYYARVLEIPSPRWVVYDAVRFGVDIPEGAETVHQERAYTSPIWYTPRS